MSAVTEFRHRSRRRLDAGGFTLLELLVVIGLVGMMSVLLVGGLAGGGSAAALQAGQATMANLITAARTKASATGHKTRLLVNADAGASARYLRCVVLQVARQAGPSPSDWDTVSVVSLPEGVYVVPPSLTQAPGLVETPANWKRPSDPASDLVSELFANQSIATALEGDAGAQSWMGVAFTATGMLAPLAAGPPTKGLLVTCLGLRRPPGSYLEGDAPVSLVNPRAARGLVLSVYGVPSWVNDSSAF